MWSIPDFTGSEQTDISLYNHSKDVAGLAHAIHKSKQYSSESLNLIIGDLPGIQKYIFNVANKKPAKVLRGRSINVQIQTRRFATIILDNLGLTDTNLIMLAGGKFYIIAQNSTDFLEQLNIAKNKIDNILIKDFNYQLSFSAAYTTFKYRDLKEKAITFGELIDETSYKLLSKRNQQFENILFPKNEFDENKFILDKKYITPNEGNDSDKIKCAVTDIPINEGRMGLLEGEQVDKQVEHEYNIGTKISRSNVVVEFNHDYSEHPKISNLKEFVRNDSSKKILINPNLDNLLEPENIKKDVLRNAQIIEVANYITMDKENNTVLDFGKMEGENNGAKFLTLIKGDVDNLGLIMSSGLVDESNDYTAISRTTTLSNHLKYFFSYSLNGFLEDWENGNISKSVDDNCTTDQKVYTVFAGGDDLMLIAPQSSALKLVDAFNNTFNDFVCNNPEVHISYSLTNFKNNTPIRIVDDIAEENQSEVKNEFKTKDLVERIETNPEVFHNENDKTCTRIYNTNVKNSSLEYILKRKIDLMFWEKDDKNEVTQGVLRNLLFFSRLMRDYKVNGDARLLMWHPKLTYMINRLLKKNENEYHNHEVTSFFDNVLKINKENESEAKKLEKVLYPIICEVIYGTRNSKGE